VEDLWERRAMEAPQRAETARRLRRSVELNLTVLDEVVGNLPAH
jgi:hypothetical protein